MNEQAERLTIGGSEAAAACGVDPWRSQVALWVEKTGKVEHEDGHGAEAMKWGSLLEPVIAAEVAKQLGEKVQTDMSAVDESSDPERPWMVGHLDGSVLLTDGPAVLEVKTAGLRSAPFWQDSVPAPYVLQVHHYMHLTGWKLAYVACLIGGQRLVIREVPRDDELIELMLRGEDRFVEYVETDTPPPPDGSEATDDVLRRLYPLALEGVRHLSREDAALIGELQQLRRQIKQLQSAEAEAEQAIKFALGNASVGMLEGRVLVRWPTIQQERVSLSRLREEYPDVAKACTETSSYRRFTVAGA